MKLTVRRQDLARELGLLLGVVETRSTIPMLKHLLLDAGRDGLRLAATDLEIGLRTECKADVSRPGSVAVPARAFHEIVRSLAADVVSFETEEGDWLKVEGGAFKGRMAGLAGADFPTMEAFPESGAKARVGLAVLEAMIERVLFAISAEGSRFTLGGALCKLDPTGLTLVATDGHRLAHVELGEDLPGVKEPVSVLVGRKALQAVGRLPVGGEDDAVDLAVTENHAFFQAGSRILQARLLEGTFPNYEKVLSLEPAVQVGVERAALQDAIGRVAVLGGESSKLIALEVAGDRLRLSASSAGLGEAQDEVGIEKEGTDTKIGFNHEYLSQFLQAAGCERIRIALKDGSMQGLLAPATDERWRYRYVLMPMRLE